MGGGRGASDLPPGFHFFPSDEELVIHFLRRKATLVPCQPDIVPTLLLNRYDPWELNGKALQAGDQWYFFSHATQRRVTPNGYWSSICPDEKVSSDGCDVGLKKTLAFSIGEPSEAIQTNWTMHEYHLLDGRKESSSSTSASSSRKLQKTTSSSRRLQKNKGHPNTESNNWVVCRVFDSTCGSQVGFHEEGTELSCLDEVFLSLEDYDEVSLSNN